MTVFGAVGPLCGQYNVSLNGMIPTLYNATTVVANAGQVLFYASGFGHGMHNLLFTNLPPNLNPGILSGTSLLIQQITNQSSANLPRK